MIEPPQLCLKDIEKWFCAMINTISFLLFTHFCLGWTQCKVENLQREFERKKNNNFAVIIVVFYVVVYFSLRLFSVYWQMTPKEADLKWITWTHVATFLNSWHLWKIKEIILLDQRPQRFICIENNIWFWTLS